MENNLTYTRNGDYLIPDLNLTEQPQRPLGKYGRMRKAYLKEHRPILYNQLLMSEKLYPHLQEIDETANSRQPGKSAGAAADRRHHPKLRTCTDRGKERHTWRTT